ncbi:DNA/RNA non-specific endonuclease [Leptolyngbya sp. FACHB-36]|nr:DNA/RNA non-specific endonuclease [Leptolyngbya sp. FACHB-36]
MSKARWAVAPLLGLLLMAVVGCGLLLRSPLPGFNPPAVTSVHLTLGNPSGASRTPTNYLIGKPQYALSYNNQTHTPNWVSWQLNASWLGNVPRRNDFRPDETLPSGWYRVTPSDYNGSGFDRGHMTPSADRSSTVENNSATFLMTNILPQAPDNNQGPWAELENYCRDLVRQGKELYLVAGGYGSKRTIALRRTDSPNDRIVAPANVWKVAVVLDQPGQGLQGIGDRTRVIAVNMPNNQGIRETDWRTFRVSVDSIEAATGYDLLSSLPAAIQDQLERRVDQQ